MRLGTSLKKLLWKRLGKNYLIVGISEAKIIRFGYGMLNKLSFVILTIKMKTWLNETNKIHINH